MAAGSGRNAERAFRKLDTIKDEIVWWEAGAQPPQLLADGEVTMTTAYNGRIFNAQVLENQPFERALRNDWEWWVNHTDEMNERFSSWLAR